MQNPTSQDNPSETPENGAETTSPPEPPPAPAPDPTAELQAEVVRLRDQLLRTAADFDNFRKRSRRETDDAQKRGADDMLRNLLPVFDNLNRAVAHAETSTDPKTIADGIAMVLRQFVDTLSRLGIERVPTVGQPFDPSMHEAVQQVETTEHAPGTVIAEIMSGYKTNEKLIRAAVVVVAKAVQAS
jgi:molecular chaperone GrpE